MQKFQVGQLTVSLALSSLRGQQGTALKHIQIARSNLSQSWQKNKQNTSRNHHCVFLQVNIGYIAYIQLHL